MPITRTVEKQIRTRSPELSILNSGGRVARRDEIEQLATTLLYALLEENSILEAYVRMRSLAEILDRPLARGRGAAIEAMTGSTEQVLGATLQVKALPKRWEYNDSKLERLEAERLAVDAAIKSRRKFLETIKDRLVDPDTGEIIQPARCTAEGATLQVIF